MDMFPEKELEPPEPTDEAGETQPTGEPEAAIPSQDRTDLEQSSSGEAPSSTVEGQATSTEPAPAARRPGFDAAVGEMRQELREEETKEKTGFGAGVKRFVQKVFRRKTAPLPEVTEARLDEFAIPEASHTIEAKPPAETLPGPATAPEATAEESKATTQPLRPPTEASQFNKLVRNKLTGALPGLDHIEPLVAPQEAAAEDEALEFLAPGQTHLKEHQEPEEPETTGQSILGAIRGEEQAEQEVSSIRQAALEDYEVAPAEEAEEQAAPLPRQLRRSWRDMRPIDRTLLTGVLALLGIVILGLGGYTIYQAVVPTTTPPPVTPTTSVVPIPISLSLPGGWVFPLKTGHVGENGIWDPSGAEWLQGTEICRWVSLPHTVQLEAVIRTLKANDQIQLSMSNYDNIIFEVKSIEQVPTAQIQSLAPDTTSLLVILSKPDSPTRWVVTATAVK